MFENMAQTFNGLFGKVAPGMCRLTMNGEIAVKCSNGYKSYNVKKARLTNVTNFSFNIGDEMFFIIPTCKASVGDIILIGGKPKCVIEVDKKIISVIDYENSEIRQVVPERHVFMGNTYYYGKIVSMFGDSFKGGKGPGNMIKMMMISQMMGSNQGQGQNSNNFMGSMGQMMAMSMFMGKDSNPFEGIFGDLDFTADEDEDKDDKTKDDKDEE